MKKIISVVLLTVLFVSGITSIIYANDDSESYPEGYDSYEQYLNDPNYFSQENQLQREEKLKEVENNPINVNSRAAVRINTADYFQEKSYWCGPTCAQVVLKHETGIKYSQSSLASNMGTTSSSGTYVYRLVQELNSRMKSAGKSFRFVATLDRDSDYWNNMIYTTNNNHLLIYNVEKRTLNKNYTTSGGHYVVGNGYATDNKIIFSCYYYDVSPQNGVSGDKATTKNVMDDALNAGTGYYIW